MPGAFIGTGTTVVFGTSAFAAELMSVGVSGISRETVDSSHMGTTDYRTYIVGKLADPGEMSMEINFDPADEPPWNDDAETVTITFPDNPGGAGSTWAASMAVTDFEATDALEDKMTATLTLKILSAITVTPHV